jgi:cytidylate kinase
MSLLVVAIDGPAGVGKSTLARRMARALGLPYVNTGLMYRAVTHEALRRGLDLEDAGPLAEVARALSFDLSPGAGAGAELSVEGSPPSPELSSAEVEEAVSTVAAHLEVRAVLREEQRRLSRGGGVVEGRDIGSVVCPDADVKLFLTASAGERASRRAGERAAEPEPVAAALGDRDQRDARTNPLVPAPDAFLLDTSGKDADTVFREAMAVVHSALGERA